jgi:predicted NUDIX family phosphoesterase
MATITQQNQAVVPSLEESILVVKRDYLIGEDEEWHGIRLENINRYLNIINTKKEFMVRSLAEIDPRYKQIIPYLIFLYEERIFVMQRTAQASETRLQNKYTIGIGGHIRQEDMKCNDIFAWANREFHEEVSYHDTLTIETLGVLNDDSNDVGRVHMGFVFLLNGTSDTISIKSELKSGTFMTLDECVGMITQFESWSQIVIGALCERRNRDEE